MDASGPDLHLAQILIAVGNPQTAPGLVRLAAALDSETPACELVALHIVTAPKGMGLEEARSYILGMREGYEGALVEARDCAAQLGVPLRTELRVERDVVPGILGLAAEMSQLGLVLLGWQSWAGAQRMRRSVPRGIVSRARLNLGVLKDRGLEDIRRILVPIGWGPHARLGLRLAERLARNTDAAVTAFRVLPATGEVDWEGERAAFVELVNGEAPSLRYDTELRLVRDASAERAILAEARRLPYDLLVIGASDEWWLRNWLFGALPDRVAALAPCSVLVVRSAPEDAKKR